jgi:hypothetical protein
MAIYISRGSRLSFAPRPEDIPEVRTRIPEQRFVPTSSASALALQTLGSSITDAGDVFAKVGAINQARDEDRETQARVMRFRQDIFDLTYGNKDAGIQGYNDMKGDAAVSGAAAIRAKIAEMKRINVSEITNPRTLAAFNKSANQHEMAFQNGHASYVAQQRNFAEIATDTADLNLFYKEMVVMPPFATDPLTGQLILDANGDKQLNPMLVAVKTKIMYLTQKIAAQADITDPDQIKNMIQNNLTTAHKQVIKHLLAEPSLGIEAAREYYGKVIGEIDPLQKSKILSDMKMAGDLEGGRKAAEEVALVGGSQQDQVARIKHMDLSVGAEKEAIRLLDANAVRERSAQIKREKEALFLAYQAAEKGELSEFLSDPDNIASGISELVIGSRAFGNVQNREKKALEGNIFASVATPANIAIMTKFRSLGNDIDKVNFDLSSIKDKLTKDQHNELEKAKERAQRRLDKTIEGIGIVRFGRKQIDENLPPQLRPGTSVKGLRTAAGRRAIKRINAAKTDLDQIIHDYREATGKDMDVVTVKKEALRLVIPIMADPSGWAEDERQLPDEAILADAIGTGQGILTISKKQYEDVRIRNNVIKENPVLDKRVIEAFQLTGKASTTALREKVAGAYLTGNHPRMEKLLPGFWGAYDAANPRTLEALKIDDQGRPLKAPKPVPVPTPVPAPAPVSVPKPAPALKPDDITDAAADARKEKVLMEKVREVLGEEAAKKVEEVMPAAPAQVTQLLDTEEAQAEVDREVTALKSVAKVAKAAQANDKVDIGIGKLGKKEAQVVTKQVLEAAQKTKLGMQTEDDDEFVPIDPPKEPAKRAEHFEISKENVQIASDEGGDHAEVYEDKVEQDGTIKIVPTGGTGHQITAKDINPATNKPWKIGDIVPENIRKRWFQEDMKKAVDQAQSLTGFSKLDSEAKKILTNMVFNMGLGFPTVGTRGKKGFKKGKGVKSFVGMLKALRKSPPDYARAAAEMEWVNADNVKEGHTSWWNQTGRRAKRLVERMKVLGGVSGSAPVTLASIGDTETA